VGGDNGAVDNVRYAVQTGVQRGLTTDEIVRTLRGTRAGDFEDGLLSGSNVDQLRAMVRTAAAHASATTRAETFADLGVEQYQFVATLDSKTSIICAANDGKVFEMGKGPMPPLHPNCRSSIVPWTGREVGNRASVDGPVPASTTFPDWLEGQPRSVQDEMLGPTRAAAWRAGDLTFAQMVGKDLQPLSIDRLRQLDRIPDPEDA
jgi:SPP1 gp7 family putative phage head morphogenesis protein